MKTVIHVPKHHPMRTCGNGTPSILNLHMKWISFMMQSLYSSTNCTEGCVDPLNQSGQDDRDITLPLCPYQELNHGPSTTSQLLILQTDNPSSNV